MPVSTRDRVREYRKRKKEKLLEEQKRTAIEPEKDIPQTKQDLKDYFLYCELSDDNFEKYLDFFAKLYNESNFAWLCYDCGTNNHIIYYHCRKCGKVCSYETLELQQSFCDKVPQFKRFYVWKTQKMSKFIEDSKEEMRKLLQRR